MRYLIERNKKVAGRREGNGNGSLSLLFSCLITPLLAYSRSPSLSFLPAIPPFLPTSLLPPSPPHLFLSNHPQPRPSSSFLPPRAPRETEWCCTSSAHFAVLYLSHLPHSVASLFLCLLPVHSSFSIRTRPPVYVQSSSIPGPLVHASFP